MLKWDRLKLDIMSTSFFLAPLDQAFAEIRHARWQDDLDIGLSKGATDASAFFQISTGRVVEVGTQAMI